MPNPRDVDRVLRLFDQLGPKEVLTPGEIALRLGPPRLAGRRLAASLRALVKRRQLVRVRGQGFHRRPPETQVEGELDRRPGGHGLLRAGDASYHVPGAELAALIDGDRVRARVDFDRRGRPFARDLELAERRNRHLVGVVERVAGAALVKAEDGMFGDPVRLSHDSEVADGDLVEIELEPPPALRGRVVQVLGRAGHAAHEVVRIVVNNGVQLVHPPAAEAEAAAAAAPIPDAERAQRIDLRDLPLVTIDGADACDFDDAVFATRRGDGWRLVVAIADVAHYVAAGSALDREARRRATSIYWPGGVAHMLPERLAADLCSLRPEAERCALVAELMLDREGGLEEASLFEAVICSQARLTYDQVNAALAGDAEQRRALGPRWPLVEAMGELAALLDERLRRGGRLDLDIPEPFFTLDDEGEPVDAYPRPMERAERLIEAFMVAANSAVARWSQARALPVLYRVHEAPRADKLAPFAETAAALTGQHLPPLPDARTLSRTLTRAQRDSDRRLLSNLLLRSLPQARYDPQPLGHYGLGLRDYLHFTSPIRRYPDLLVHRALKADLHGRTPARRAAVELNNLAPLVNARERQAMALERTIDSMLSAHLAAKRVGERYCGAVVGVERFGLFVSVERPLFEGFLPARRLRPDDYYRQSRDGLALVGRRRRRRFRLGDPVTVEIAAVDVAKRQIDLFHVDDEVA